MQYFHYYPWNLNFLREVSILKVNHFTFHSYNFPPLPIRRSFILPFNHWFLCKYKGYEAQGSKHHLIISFSIRASKSHSTILTLEIIQLDKSWIWDYHFNHGLLFVNFTFLCTAGRWGFEPIQYDFGRRQHFASFKWVLCQSNCANWSLNYVMEHNT